MKAYIRITQIILWIGMIVPIILTAQIEILSDPLDGSTIGQQMGNGDFMTGGGWRSQGGKIVYDAGRILESGSFEAVMRGWTAPAQGAEKSHPLSGWEVADLYTHWIQTGCFWNWRIGSRYNPFKVLAASEGTRLDTWWEIATNDMINDGLPHLYKVAWASGNVTFYLDSDSLHQFEFNTFRLRYFTIGVDDMYGPTDPAPIISDIRIVDNHAVIADFSADTTSGSVPLTVHFSDSSKGNILGYFWDFGDGRTSSEQHPTHMYETADTFTVSLMVTGPGKPDTLIRENYIRTFHPAPIADFTADTTSGFRPLEVQFTNLSSGMIATWLWDFGDGETGTGQHPSHVFQTADTFTVSLTVNGPGGEGTKTEPDYIVVLETPPVAEFTADTTEGIIPFEVQFTDQSTGQIASWFWEFGDGETSTDQHPVHIYDISDTLDVSLTVTGSGGEDAKTRNGYIITSEVTGADNSIYKFPDRFALMQNYPNPFNPATTIKYCLSEDGPVRLILTDLKGREILRLVEDDQGVGWHTVEFFADDLASGMYVYQLQSGTKRLSRKLILLK